MKKLSGDKKSKAMKGPMLISKKKCGRFKGRLLYNGKPTHEWKIQEAKSYPTTLNQVITLCAAIDAYEYRSVMYLDVPNTCIQTPMDLKDDEDKFIMKVRGEIFD